MSLAKAGWTKRDVRAFLFDQARKPLTQVKHWRHVWSGNPTQPMAALDRSSERSGAYSHCPSGGGYRHPGGWRRGSSFGVSAWLGVALGNAEDPALARFHPLLVKEG